MTTAIKAGTLAEAAQANIETGLWLLCKDFLITAIQDRRLERGHLRVLAAFVMVINHRTAKAWPDRATLAAMTGLSVATVANYISELRQWKYLIVDREYVETAGGRKLMVYTFGNVDHETIRSEITKFAQDMQRKREEPSSTTSPPTVNFTAHGELPTSPPTVKKPTTSPRTVKSASPPAVIPTPKTSPPAVDSNYSKTLPISKVVPLNVDTAEKVAATTIKRGSRLPSDWVLPKSWGEWALGEFVTTPSQIRSEGSRFKDYWIAKAGRDAIKVDWEATWRNWMRNDKFKPRAAPLPTDDLLSRAAAPNGAADEWAKVREQQLAASDE